MNRICLIVNEEKDTEHSVVNVIKSYLEKSNIRVDRSEEHTSELQSH